MPSLQADAANKKRFSGKGGANGTHKLKLRKGKGATTILHARLPAPLTCWHRLSVAHESSTGGVFAHRADANITVPLGTQVLSESGYLIADLDQHEQAVIVARGGDGGSALTDECVVCRSLQFAED